MSIFFSTLPAVAFFCVWAWRASFSALVLRLSLHVHSEKIFKKKQPTNPRRPKTQKISPSDAEDETN